MIAGLLLAAGRSSRFGGDKLLAPLRGHPVLFWSAAALASAVDALYVVVSPDEPARAMALAGTGAVIVPHAGRDAGMSSSIRAGVAALSEQVDAVVIALADQPLVAAGTVRALCDRWRAARADAVAPRYRDGRGHPVLFDRVMFGALSALEGDAGARDVLQSLGERLVLVPVDASAPVDVDTPEALHALAASWRNER